MIKLIAELDATVSRLMPGHGVAIYHLGGLHEPFSAATHLIGAIVFLLLGLELVRRAGTDRRRQALLTLYAVSCVVLLLMSGVYHASTKGNAINSMLLRLDHAAIFVLIAGTFTPVHGLLFRGWLRWAPLLLLWAIALGGVIVKTAYFATMSESVSTTLYLTMGWCGLFCGSILWKQRGFAFIRPLLFGGICYFVGAIMDFCHWPVIIPGVIHAHDVFHVAVLCGMAFHFSFIWRIAPPATAQRDPMLGEIAPIPFVPAVSAARL